MMARQAMRLFQFSKRRGRASAYDPAASMSDPPRSEDVDDLLDDMQGTPTARQMAVTKEYLERIPRVVAETAELNASELEPREYFLVSLLDGHTTVEVLLDISGMPAEAALALLDGLVRRGLVGF
jgi:hypothetical protein